MRICRGTICLELSIDEFMRILEDEERVENVMDLIYDLEMDQAMQYNPDEVMELEKSVYEQMKQKEEKESISEEREKVKRILSRLEKYDV